MRHAAILGLLWSIALLGCGKQARGEDRTTNQKSGNQKSDARKSVVDITSDLDLVFNQGSFASAISKGGIERPLERAIAGTQPKLKKGEQAPAANRAVELPVKNTIVGKRPVASDKFRNPQVEPGKVRWHKDFETACAASKESGKPVLLFQMIGKLDDRFC